MDGKNELKNSGHKICNSFGKYIRVDFQNEYKRSASYKVRLFLLSFRIHLMKSHKFNTVCTMKKCYLNCKQDFGEFIVWKKFHNAH
jgi:hypothetical protein